MSEQIKALIESRTIAKRAEEAAATHRKSIDEQIIALLPKPEDKNTASLKVEDFGIKVTVTYGTNKTVDADALRDAAAKLPQSVIDAFRWKPEVDAKKWDSLSDEHKLQASKFVTTKPASPSIKFELS